MICKPLQIYKHKAIYYSLYQFNRISDSRRSKIKEKGSAISKQKSDILSTKAQHILKSSNNFIEENIGNITARMWKWLEHLIAYIIKSLCLYSTNSSLLTYRWSIKDSKYISKMPRERKKTVGETRKKDGPIIGHWNF